MSESRSILSIIPSLSKSSAHIKTVISGDTKVLSEQSRIPLSLYVPDCVGVYSTVEIPVEIKFPLSKISHSKEVKLETSFAFNIILDSPFFFIQDPSVSKLRSLSKLGGVTKPE